MQKIKSLNWSSLLSIIKCCMLGILATLIGVIIFAIVLKFVDLSSNVIGYINDVIKAISIFVMILCLKRANGEKLIIKAIFAGLLYAILSMIIFAILNQNFAFNLSILNDILFAVIVSVVVSVIVNLTSRKTV